MDYKQIRNPKWANKEHSVLDCEVDFDDLVEEFVPFTVTNIDKYPYVVEIFKRCVNGDFGIIQEYVAPIEHEPTQDEIKESFIIAIQNLLDSKAREKKYDNILSACSYAGYPNVFRSEGEAFGTWMAMCWQKGYQILADAESGVIGMPTIEEVLAEMPILVLPNG